MLQPYQERLWAAIDSIRRGEPVAPLKTFYLPAAVIETCYAYDLEQYWASLAELESEMVSRGVIPRRSPRLRLRERAVSSA